VVEWGVYPAEILLGIVVQRHFALFHHYVCFVQLLGSAIVTLLQVAETLLLVSSRIIKSVQKSLQINHREAQCLERVSNEPSSLSSTQIRYLLAGSILSKATHHFVQTRTQSSAGQTLKLETSQLNLKESVKIT
jgi:uncharacterized metal-binding protein